MIWVKFYMEFATKLLEYKNDRKSLISKLQDAYKSIGLKFPKVDSNDVVTDMDPFTIFGLFNKGIPNINRTSILHSFAKTFSIKGGVPNSFDGIPVLNNLNATFYKFIRDQERGKDIDNLWKLFEAAIAYADYDSFENRESFVKVFDLVKDIKGNLWKLTMGLYWIRPLRFINLDLVNRNFLKQPSNISPACTEIINGFIFSPDGENYLNICDAVIEALKEGTYKYKNLPELSYYVKKVSSVQANTDINNEKVRYWIYSPGPGASKWEEFYRKGIIAINWGKIGDLSQFPSKEDMKVRMQEFYGSDYTYVNAGHAAWQFANDMKPGDVVFAKKGISKIIGRGIITSDYEFNPDRPDDYKNIRRINWTHNGEWLHPGNAHVKMLTDVTSYMDYVHKLNRLFESDTEDEEEEKAISYPTYNVKKFLEEVYMDEDEYYKLRNLIKNKMNVILQGAPGVGKTFAAKRLAYSIIGSKNQDRVMMVQFHQSYSYEDFIMGFRPTESGFELKNGVFYNFCKNAEIDSENPYFFIIDEINRGNLSKIFGELLMLIENDKRGIYLQLLYSNEKFSIPENVYIIGMMNTADRSLAMLDYALRRRFAFYEMKPAFNSNGFRAYRDLINNSKFQRLLDTVETLNAEISSDESLGDGFCIGHSYFCGLSEASDQNLSRIVEYELIPLLKEYWFDEPSKVKDWSYTLRNAIK